MSVAGGAATL
uniref:Uncharacterized protein n=1 Tax=Arundo donax TaxID=35708 RepID=A0A0A9CA87_ARUDO